MTSLCGWIDSLYFVYWVKREGEEEKKNIRRLVIDCYIKTSLVAPTTSWASRWYGKQQQRCTFLVLCGKGSPESRDSSWDERLWIIDKETGKTFERHQFVMWFPFRCLFETRRYDTLLFVRGGIEDQDESVRCSWSLQVLIKAIKRSP